MCEGPSMSRTVDLGWEPPSRPGIQRRNGTDMGVVPCFSGRVATVDQRGWIPLRRTALRAMSRASGTAYERQ